VSRTLAIGDIHGCLTALDTLLGLVQPTPTDQLIFLGDYIDRGADSKGVLDRLVELKKTGQVVCLRGNHEIMMLGARHGRDDYRFWLACGGLEAMQSYARPSGIFMLDDIPDAHWSFVERGCVDWYETDTHIFVHANLHPDKPLNEQITEWLHWQTIAEKWHKPHMSGKTMICGHTEQRSGRPLRLMGAVCVDTWAYGDGWLTCLDIGTDEYWQATELGQTRTGNLASGAA
jgi:serine/threonine protein phosphatase 1